MPVTGGKSGAATNRERVKGQQIYQERILEDVRPNLPVPSTEEVELKFLFNASRGAEQRMKNLP